MDRVDLKGLLPDELAGFFAQLGQPSYRAKQLFAWIHGRGVSDFEQMSDLPKGLRQQLGQQAQISRLTQIGAVVMGSWYNDHGILEIYDRDNECFALVNPTWNLSPEAGIQ